VAALDPTQLVVAFLAGTAVVSASVITAGASLLSARRSGRSANTADTVAAKVDELTGHVLAMAEQHMAVEQRVDRLEDLAGVQRTVTLPPLRQPHRQVAEPG
jgi:outer membrane murein-binding lipoprotein Lpp